MKNQAKILSLVWHSAICHPQSKHERKNCYVLTDNQFCISPTIKPIFPKWFWIRYMDGIFETACLKLYFTLYQPFEWFSDWLHVYCMTMAKTWFTINVLSWSDGRTNIGKKNRCVYHTTRKAAWAISWSKHEIYQKKDLAFVYLSYIGSRQSIAFAYPCTRNKPDWNYVLVFKKQRSLEGIFLWTTLNKWSMVEILSYTLICEQSLCVNSATNT